MTIRDRSELENKRPSIDLAGPEGNAFCLMAYAKKYAGALDLDAKAILAEMMSGDYENLLAVFEKNFGEYVDLYR